MARRRNRRKQRRSTPKTINAAKVLEAAMIGSAVTQGFFNVGIGDFVLNSGSMDRNQITARELISGITGQSGGFGTTSSVKLAQIGGGYATITAGNPFAATVKQNLMDNGAQMVGSLIVIPAAFKVFNKLTRQPRSMANKALKMSGLPVRV
tara:strand:+ start:1565 stop:2017 length:453 start_codon:yes stop_codon:yes gene_type:complete